MTEQQPLVGEEMFRNFNVRLYNSLVYSRVSMHEMFAFERSSARCAEKSTIFCFPGRSMSNISQAFLLFLYVHVRVYVRSAAATPVLRVFWSCVTLSSKINIRIGFTSAGF